MVRTPTGGSRRPCSRSGRLGDPRPPLPPAARPRRRGRRSGRASRGWPRPGPCCARAGRTSSCSSAADRVGGTWRDNVYPGAACDVRSDLYQLSRRARAGVDATATPASPRSSPTSSGRWTGSASPRTCTGAPTCSGRPGTTTRRCGGCAPTAATSRPRSSSSAPARSCSPAGPTCPASPRSPGPLLHTARWDASVDLADRRVGVVGTGASAGAARPRAGRDRRARHGVPALRPVGAAPRGPADVGGPAGAVPARCPAAQRLVPGARSSSATTSCTSASRTGGSARWSSASCCCAWPPRCATRDLRRRLRPGYRLGCKRVTISDDWYPTLARPDVTLVDQPVVEVTPTGVRTADGRHTDLDVLVCSTGFVATEPPVARLLRGRDGRTLAEHWDRRRHAGPARHHGHRVPEPVPAPRAATRCSGTTASSTWPSRRSRTWCRARGRGRGRGPAAAGRSWRPPLRPSGPGPSGCARTWRARCGRPAAAPASTWTPRAAAPCSGPTGPRSSDGSCAVPGAGTTACARSRRSLGRASGRGLGPRPDSFCSSSMSRDASPLVMPSGTSRPASRASVDR